MAWIKKWFFAPVRENENNAQTVFRVLGNILRWLLTAFVLMCVFLFALSILESTQSKKLASERDKITISSISFNEEVCSEKIPIHIIVKNDGKRSLEKMDFEIIARHKGRSTNLLNYSEKERNWDFITDPGRTRGACYGFGTLAKTEKLEDLSWSVDIKDYSINFAD